MKLPPFFLFTRRGEEEEESGNQPQSRTRNKGTRAGPHDDYQSVNHYSLSLSLSRARARVVFEKLRVGNEKKLFEVLFCCVFFFSTRKKTGKQRGAAAGSPLEVSLKGDYKAKI